VSTADTQAPQTEADLSVDDFVSRGNARDRGEDIPLIEDADEKSGAAGAPVSDTVTAGVEKPADRTASADKSIDKRTREGKKQSIQQEIDELTTAKHSTRREVEAAQAELARLRAELAHVSSNGNGNGAKPATATAPSYDGTDPNDPEPKLEQFANDPSGDPYTAWIMEKAAHRARREFRVQAFNAQQTAQKSQAETVYQTRMNGLQEKVAKHEATDKDWRTKVDPEVASALKWSTPVEAGTPLGELVMDSDNPVEYMIYFSEHKKEFQRITTLHPFLQGVAFGEIKGRLAVASSRPDSKPQPISHAKPPIKPLGSSPVVSDDAEDEGELPLEQFVKIGNARERRR